MRKRSILWAGWLVLLVAWLIHISLTPLFGEKVDHLVPEVISTLPHDPSAFTQGLLIDQEDLYESTGLYGKSSLRRLNLKTGEILDQILLPEDQFGEGVTYWQGRLIQLTWKEEVSLVYQPKPLALLYQLAYEGEGWGLCTDGQSLLMTNGSSQILQRDPSTLAVQKTLNVSFKGQTISRLNDLVCVGNDIYANVWRTNYIIRIDKTSGKVTAVIDASGLLSAKERKALGKEAVLNGIAYHEATQTFFITGKYWPLIFEVRFVPVAK
ncbi:glutaminyl-peptide cyclotransferase [Candidatus Protochlamydia phocaeensis]|uniref:glutaminyl-peptide cyclotransferase n=1 Tax=Candidatus Protochlamydia phocaeensis TaxID=1414722 RepID=UPI0009AE8E30|nr:glutaminyl-peptide cyclotransferase [Candidatus Protochlamydia phocaeensis]